MFLEENFSVVDDATDDHNGEDKEEVKDGEVCGES